MNGLFSGHELVEAKHAGEIETHGRVEATSTVRSESTPQSGKGALLDGLSCSGHRAEDLLYKGSLRQHVTPGHGTHLSLGQHRHRLDAGQRPLRRPEALKAQHGPDQALDPAVVLFDPVVEPAPTPVPGEAPQLALLLHLAQRAGIALEAVGHDLARVAGVLPGEGTLEETLCCLLVPLGTEPEVDRLAGAIDRSIHVAPFSADPDVSLVNVPRP